MRPIQGTVTEDRRSLGTQRQAHREAQRRLNLLSGEAAELGQRGRAIDLALRAARHGGAADAFGEIEDAIAASTSEVDVSGEAVAAFLRPDGVPWWGRCEECGHLIDTPEHNLGCEAGKEAA